MLSDENFTSEELSVIASGYEKLMEQSLIPLEELKSVVNINGLSMTDAERMAVIDKAYISMKECRDLTEYYTRKNISVSYLRAKKKQDTKRVLSLYGNNERYW